METRKSLQSKTTCVLAFSLFAIALAAWLYSGYADDKRTVVLGLHVAAAIGLLWIGWYCLKLFDVFRKAVKLIKQGEVANLKKSGNCLTGELFQAIKNRISVYLNYITELERQVRNMQIKVRLLRRLKRNTDAVLLQIPDAMIVIDEFNKLIMANKAAEKLFNFDLKSSKYKPINEVITSSCLVEQSFGEQKKSNFVNLLYQSKQNRSHTIKHEIVLTGKKDECDKSFDCSVSCIYENNGRLWGIVAVLHDITRKKQIDRLKDDFVGHVSHELKTPLASITAYSEMLAGSDVKDEQTKNRFYSVIQKQAKKLNQLIEDLLDTSRIESGMIKIEKQHFNLQTLITEQLQVIKSYAGRKKIKIIEPHNKNAIIFGQVYADRNMVAQVITNLLTNAVKYTKQGGAIKIETDIDEAENFAKVTVTDTGIGIKEDRLMRIFDKYYRAGTDEHQEKGFGLGLNLVKQIVEKLHGGRVFVSSTPGVGSIFGFELPLAKTEKVLQPQSL